MRFQIPHGRDFQPLEVSDRKLAGFCLPKPMTAAKHPTELVRQRVETAANETGLATRVRPGMKACIVVTDRTRSTPLGLIVPLLLEQLQGWGITDEKVTVISGGGMHAADSSDDMKLTLGPDVLKRVEVLTNEPDNLTVMAKLGQSDLGTPVEVHRRFAEAEIKLGIINVRNVKRAVIFLVNSIFSF